MADSFYWHDYETFGTDPARDRPVQFAGLRTDLELNPVGDPLLVFSRPAGDVLPHPEACLVTGITPQQALAEGEPEARFIAQIHEQLAQPGTCALGYNSLRFDDEFTRHTLYRNFYDPYAREYQHGNSRWDLLDVVRTAFALRPEGIQWPLNDQGLPSFRLEHLTAANGIEHGAAHDALADVQATIAVARLLRDRQPRLFEHLYSQRGKQAAMGMLDIDAMKPVLHVSGMFGSARHNIALIVPLLQHPDNRNEIICYDLGIDPDNLLSLEPEALAGLLFARREEIPDGSYRPGLKSVHINRCPVLLPAKMLSPEQAQRLGIDSARLKLHLSALREARQRDPAGWSRALAAIYAQRQFPEHSDPDRLLYGGGFFSDADRRLMDMVREAQPEALVGLTLPFGDARLPEMLLRYRARNYPETLTAEERSRWQQYCVRALTSREEGADLDLESYEQRVASLLAASPAPRDTAVLEALRAWGEQQLAATG